MGNCCTNPSDSRQALNMEKKSIYQIKSSMGGKKSDMEDVVQDAASAPTSLAIIRKPAPTFTADAWWQGRF